MGGEELQGFNEDFFKEVGGEGWERGGGVRIGSVYIDRQMICNGDR